MRSEVAPLSHACQQRCTMALENTCLDQMSAAFGGWGCHYSIYSNRVHESNLSQEIQFWEFMGRFNLGVMKALSCPSLFILWQQRVVNSLYTQFHFQEVLLRLLIPCMIRVSTSAISQHWKLQLSILPSSLSGFVTSALPTHQRAYNGQGPPTSECFS